MGSNAENVMMTVGAVRRLSIRTQPSGLPPSPGRTAPGPRSNYLKDDVNSVTFDESKGLVGDCSASLEQVERDRDILFIDETGLRFVVSKDSPPTIGQNVTLAGLDVRTWCVGDRIAVGEHAVVRITSPRKPCPRNDNVHGAGTMKLMMKEALGGVFGRVEVSGTVTVGDKLRLLSRPSPRFQCGLVYAYLYGPDKLNDPKRLREIAALPYLEKPRFAEVAAARARKLEGQQLLYRWSMKIVRVVIYALLAFVVFHYIPAEYRSDEL